MIRRTWCAPMHFTTQFLVGDRDTRSPAKREECSCHIYKKISVRREFEKDGKYGRTI